MGANGKIFAVKGLDLLPMLQKQMRDVALDKKRARDDLADSCVYALNFVFDRWIRSGLALGTCAGKAEATVHLVLPSAVGVMGGQCPVSASTAWSATPSLGSANGAAVDRADHS